MPDKNLLDFDDATKIGAADYLHISQGGVDKKIAADDLLSQINGGTPFNVTVREQTGTTRILTRADINCYIPCINPSDTTISIGPAATFGWKLGDTFVARKSSTGDVTAVGGAGVIINPAPSGLSLTEYGQNGQWIHVGNDVWDLITGGGSADLAPNALPYSATITPDLSEGSFREIPLSGNITVNAPSNSTNGSSLIMSFTAGGGDRTISFNSAYKVGSYSTVVTQNTRSIYKFVQHSTGSWFLHSFTEGLPV